MEEESYTLSLSRRSSHLQAPINPPLDLSPEKNYFLGLVSLLTNNSIPNIDTDHNKLYVEDKIIVLPTGSYEISEIESYLLNQIPEGTTFSLKPNYNSLRSEITCSQKVDFRPPDSIAPILGFAQRTLEPGKIHISDQIVNILKVSAIRVECNITCGAFLNGQRVHTVHEFGIKVPPGFKINETPGIKKNTALHKDLDIGPNGYKTQIKEDTKMTVSGCNHRKS
ncbi:hypothetical protein QAD02_004533 [Eretmocerus hayati]|uniref:Uncharacterized protein n=1 Tax=Eretmocerus hayati TaxID=131215 RepID=A0ACC2NRN6_9HYME|nr:hypothetical protein QAD02_004533 [Eretmocerus hayati]